MNTVTVNVTIENWVGHENAGATVEGNEGSPVTKLYYADMDANNEFVLATGATASDGFWAIKTNNYWNGGAHSSFTTWSLAYPYIIYQVNEVSESDLLTAVVDAEGVLSAYNNQHTPTTSETGLITAASQLASNAGHNEFNGNDGQGIPALVDGNTGTYFHSKWGGDVTAQHHMLQADLGEGAYNLVQIKYTSRGNNYKHNLPQVVDIYGTNDASAVALDGSHDYTTADYNLSSWTGKWTKVASLTAPQENTVTIDHVAIAGYRYLRFDVVSTYSANKFFCLSTFQVFSQTVDKRPQHSSQQFAMQKRCYRAIAHWLSTKLI